MKHIITIILLFITTFAFSQVDNLSLKRNIFYQDEITFGLIIKNNGWGMDFRRGYFKSFKYKDFYEIGLFTIKHPKEQKISYTTFGNKYVYGKLNQIYNIKTGVGKQINLFQKKEIGTVDVRLIISTGLDLAILKPIYYEINNYPNASYYQKYLPSHQPGLIIGKAPFTKGLNETTINPAAYFKLGTSFEHSKSINAVNSLELGMEASIFLKKLNIMAEVDNPRLIVSLFVAFRIGTLKKNHQKKNDIDNL